MQLLTLEGLGRALRILDVRLGDLALHLEHLSEEHDGLLLRLIVVSIVAGYLRDIDAASLLI